MVVVLTGYKVTREHLAPRRPCLSRCYSPSRQIVCRWAEHSPESVPVGGSVRSAALWIALLISQIFKRLLFTEFHISKTFCIPLISKSHFTIQSRLHILQVIEPEDNGYATCWEDFHFAALFELSLSSGIPMYGAFPLYRTWCCTSIITSNKTLAAPSTNLGRFPQNELQSSEKKRCQFVIVTLLSKRFKIIPSAT